MELLRTCYQVSTRRASQMLPGPRSTIYYRSPKPEQAPLRHRIKEIAAIRVRYGYRRIHTLLQWEGWVVNLIICDNATWHKKKSLEWGNFEAVFLPPYSPDLNPIERLWLLIKAEWFSDFITKERQQLTERLDQALLWVMNRPQGNQQTCSLDRFL